MTIDRSNQVWALDTTYIPMAKGLSISQPWLTMPVARGIGGQARHHLGGLPCRRCFAGGVYSPWRAPEIANTDQGSQFTAEALVQAVHDRGCKLSMDVRGSWRDNVIFKLLWKTVKCEQVYLRAYGSVTVAKASIMAYMG